MGKSGNSHLDKPSFDPFLYIIPCDGYYEITISSTYTMRLNISWKTVNIMSGITTYR